MKSLKYLTGLGLIIFSTNAVHAACGKVIGVQTVSDERKIHVTFQTQDSGRFELSGYNIAKDDPFMAEKLALAIAARLSGKKLCISGSDLAIE